MLSSDKALRRSSLRCEQLEDRVVPATANENQITRLYTDLLNREANAADLAAWNTQLSNGVTLTQAAILIQTSAEGRNQTVREFFDSALDRVPDQASLDFWSTQLLTKPIEVVHAEILGGNEFFTKSGGTNSAFLTALYDNVLDRAIDTGGSNYFTAELNSGMSRAQVAAQVLTSVEGHQDLVRSYYQKFLGRSPEAAGLTSWTNQLAAGVSDQVVAALITSSPEYQAQPVAGVITVTSPGAQTNRAGAAVSVQIAATTTNGRALSYTATGLPSGLSIGSSTGRITGTIASAAELLSPYTVTVTAKDGISPAATTTFTWTVTAAATGLSIVAPASQSNANGTTVTGVTVSATGTTTGALTYTASNLPPGLSINSTTGVISGTISATASNNSPYNVAISVTQNGVTSSGSFTWVTPTTSTSTLPFSLIDDGWITLPSGTRYKDVTPGTGTAAKVGDSLNVDYTGYLTSGATFDSNNGVNFSLQTGSLIDGWVEAIPGMKPGGVRLLDIPSSQAYGSTPRTGIPANSELVFRVKLNSAT